MTVVVEARERSGSLITAEMAQDLNREVGAVPGRVGSSPAAGTNGLLRDGASVIRGAPGRPRLDARRRASSVRAPAAARGPALEPELAEVLDLVERGREQRRRAGACVAAWSQGHWRRRWCRLELGGYLRSDSAGRYERTALAAPESA